MNALHTPDENITPIVEPLMQQLQEHQHQLLVDVILQLGSPHANASASQR
jgi:hypothetical protein